MNGIVDGLEIDQDRIELTHAQFSDDTLLFVPYHIDCESVLAS